MMLSILKTIDMRKKSSNTVAQNPILNNFVIKSFVKILLVWLLLGGVFKNCYHGNKNTTDNRTCHCKLMSLLLNIWYRRYTLPPPKSNLTAPLNQT